MRISVESPNQTNAIALIAELDAYQSALYPPESPHTQDLASVAGKRLLFVLAREDAGQAVGCGTVVLSTEYGGLKRMFVRPQQRGLGIATKIRQTLGAAASSSACSVLTLESGSYQPEALGLYTRCGYERCGPFGD